MYAPAVQIYTPGACRLVPLAHPGEVLSTPSSTVLPWRMETEGIVAHTGTILANYSDQSATLLLRLERQCELMRCDRRDTAYYPPESRTGRPDRVATGTSHTQRSGRPETERPPWLSKMRHPSAPDGGYPRHQSRVGEPAAASGGHPWSANAVSVCPPGKAAVARCGQAPTGKGHHHADGHRVSRG
jgi:hypothetical protein